MNAVDQRHPCPPDINRIADSPSASIWFDGCRSSVLTRWPSVSTRNAASYQVNDNNASGKQNKKKSYHPARGRGSYHPWMCVYGQGQGHWTRQEKPDLQYRVGTKCIGLALPSASFECIMMHRGPLSLQPRYMSTQPLRTSARTSVTMTCLRPCSIPRHASARKSSKT